MERLYDYVMSYTTGSVGNNLLIQHVHLYYAKEKQNMELTGLAGFIMQNNLKHQDFVI